MVPCALPIPYSEKSICLTVSVLVTCVHTKGGHATARFLEGFFEGSLKEVLLRRVLRRYLVRVSVRREVLGRVLRRRECHRRSLQGRNTPFRRVQPPLRAL